MLLAKARAKEVQKKCRYDLPRGPSPSCLGFPCLSHGPVPVVDSLEHGNHAGVLQHNKEVPVHALVGDTVGGEGASRGEIAGTPVTWGGEEQGSYP